MHRMERSYYLAMTRLAQENRVEKKPKQASACSLHIEVDLEPTSPLSSLERKEPTSSEINQFLSPCSSSYMVAIQVILEKLKEHKSDVKNLEALKLIDSPLSNKKFIQVLNILSPLNLPEKRKSPTQSPGAISRLKIKNDVNFNKMQEALACVTELLPKLEMQKNRDENLLKDLQDTNHILQSLIQVYHDKVKKVRFDFQNIFETQYSMRRSSTP